MKRRQLIQTIGTAIAVGSTLDAFAADFKKSEDMMSTQLNNKINHSACRWCYNTIPLEDLAKKAKEIGLVAIDLLGPEEWPVVQKYGLTCSMVMTQPKTFGITKGFNRIENHDVLVPFYEDLIIKAAAAGLKNVICFSGNRAGLDDETGIKNCAIGLKKLMPSAEKNKIVLQMELLNSKLDHKDYQCDHTLWGVNLCKAIGSENFKLLFDIYHMQIMDGDIIRNIRDYHQYFGHYHTGGVPGRNEIDTTQELYYPSIMQAIVDTGYKGYVAQEFIPKEKDKLASLEKCVKICDI